MKKKSLLFLLLIAGYQLLLAATPRQDLLQDDRKEIRAIVREIMKSPRMPREPKLPSAKDLETMILFLQDPVKHFASVQRIPDPYQYISAYESYLHRSGRSYDFLIITFLEKNFKHIDEDHIPILAYLPYHWDGGMDGEFLSTWAGDLLAASPEVFARYYSKKANWKALIKDFMDGILPQDLLDAKKSLERLESTGFAGEFRTFVSEYIAATLKKFGLDKLN